jgi:hypothetical protein
MADKPKYERKCKNWLADFGKWTLPRSEAPETFIFWTGIFTLAAVIRRHVMIPRSYMGGWEVTPNVYIMFVADPGKARKSTTANYAEDLFEITKGLTRPPELISKEALLSTLAESDDQSLAILAPEFGEFIAKSGVDMYGWLTNMYDGKRRISAKTISRGLELAERPCVNMLGATTPAWIADNMPESVIGGGFASRVIFIFEETVRRRQLYYNHLDWPALNQLQKDLASDLNHIATIEGEFTIEEKTQAWMEKWYRGTADQGRTEDYKMHGYFERRPAYVHKLAMIIHLSKADDLVLVQSDFDEAIVLLNQIERKLPMTFQAIGRNPYAIDIKRIYQYIQEQGEVSKITLLRAWMHTAEQDKLESFITNLASIGYIKVEARGDDLIISPAKGNGSRHSTDLAGHQTVAAPRPDQASEED